MDYSPFLPEPHPPFSRLFFWLVAMGVIGVMWGALALSGRVGDGDALTQACAEANIPGTARVIGHDESAHTITFTWSDATEMTLTLPYDPERIFEGCSASAKRVLARAYREKGGTSENAIPLPRVMRRPDRLAPLAEECPQTEGNIVTIRLKGKTQEGECVALRAEQQLMFMNDTNFSEMIRVAWREPFPEFPTALTVLPHATSTIPFAVREYLATGVHHFSGDPSYIPEIQVLP